jgi:hypothetical protein
MNDYMIYKITPVKKINYVKSYIILRRINENTNFISKLFENLINKYVIKKPKI